MAKIMATTPQPTPKIEKEDKKNVYRGGRMGKWMK
jgi:hypothetical protein